MPTCAYLRVSKHTQDVHHQRLAILEFARCERLTVDEFLELTVSSRRAPKERKVDLLLARLVPGDTLLVSELSRLGRSVGEIITTGDTLVKRQIRLLAIKEGSRLEGAQDLQTRAMVTEAVHRRHCSGMGVGIKRSWNRRGEDAGWSRGGRWPTNSTFCPFCRIVPKGPA